MSKPCHSTEGTTILFMGCNRIVECLDPAAGVPCHKDGTTIGHCLFCIFIHLYAAPKLLHTMVDVTSSTNASLFPVKKCISWLDWEQHTNRLISDEYFW